MMVRAVAAALGALAWVGAPSAMLTQSNGRVTGTVKLTLANSAPSSASAYERRSIGPRPKAPPELKNVVLFFTDLPAARAAPMRALIAQKDEQFAPHMVAITAGSSVAFPNADPFFHNVFSLSRGAAFNLGRYPSGASRAKTFNRPGIVKVFCEIHSHMSAVIRVFDHDWFTVPDASTDSGRRSSSGRSASCGPSARSGTLTSWPCDLFPDGTGRSIRSARWSSAAECRLP